MTAITRRLAAVPLTQPYVIAILVWVLSMIAVPIALWTWGEGVIPTAATVTTLIQFSAVSLILVKHWGLRRTLITFAIVAVLTWGAEAIGSKTGFPFGEYTYTDALQPQFLGVPLLIPVAWFMMLPPAWAVAYTLLGGKISPIGRRVIFVLVSAAALTAWDLFLDPQMVNWGFWIWANPSGYFGIPFINYFGWMLTATLVTAAVRPDRLPIIPLLVVYAIVWVLQSIGLALFWGQPGPAFFGFLGMGIMLGAALWRLREQKGFAG